MTLQSRMQSIQLARLRSSILLKPVLCIFSLIFGLLIRSRNALFDWQIFKSRAFDIPVISVGNLSSGGSGKTPFTMELINLLSQKYKRIAVISRGYKRKSRGVQLVSDGLGRVAGAATGGDEPVLIAKRFPGCLVLVAEKRSLAIQRACEQYQADLVILDDAFQHRWVKRNVDIVLLSKSDLTPRCRLLPAGDLREPLTALKRAHMIIMVNRKQNDIQNDLRIIRPYYHGEIEYYRLQATGLVDVTLTPAGDLRQLHGLPVVAFAGIANPDSFKRLILQADIVLRRFFIFPDHHFYSDTDIARITSSAAEEQCTCLLTTEKDMVKLAADRFDGLHLLAMRIRLILESPQQLQQKLYDLVDKTI